MGVIPSNLNQPNILYQIPELSFLVLIIYYPNLYIMCVENQEKNKNCELLNHLEKCFGHIILGFQNEISGLNFWMTLCPQTYLYLVVSCIQGKPEIFTIYCHFMCAIGIGKNN